LKPLRKTLARSQKNKKKQTKTKTLANKKKKKRNAQLAKNKTPKKEEKKTPEPNPRTGSSPYALRTQAIQPFALATAVSGDYHNSLSQLIHGAKKSKNTYLFTHDPHFPRDRINADMRSMFTIERARYLKTWFFLLNNGRAGPPSRHSP
jgi:hypothetical protein